MDTPAIPWRASKTHQRVSYAHFVRAQAATFAVPALLLLILVTIYWSMTIDDAYITARYAQNLVAGNGPVFDIGSRVEGYSDPTWLLLMTIAQFFAPSHLMGIAKLAAVVSTVGLLALVARGARALESAPAVIVATVAFVSLPSVVLWSVAGLETTAYALLALGAIYVAAKPTPGKREAVLAGTLIALAALTRPEGSS